MDTRVDRLAIEARRDLLWTLITTPTQLAKLSFGLTYESTWAAGADVRVSHGGQRVAEGVVVLAEAPTLLMYRLDVPETGEVDSWVSWQIDLVEAYTCVSLLVDTLHGPAPDYGAQMLQGVRALAGAHR